MMCENCLHENVCIHRENMKKLKREIIDKTKLLENQTFCVSVSCKNFNHKRGGRE